MIRLRDKTASSDKVALGASRASATEPRLLTREDGISLLELMAAMVISLIIIAAGFTALVSGQKAAQVNDFVAETQQNARIAMELLSRDIKMAGFGMTGPVGACNVAGTAAPIVPADNNPAGADIGPDSISLVLPNTNSTVAPVWTLRTQADGPFNEIELQPGSVAPMQAAGLGVGSTVSIGGAVSSTVTIIDEPNDKLTLQNQIGPPKVFPIGTQVFLLQCITYSISTNPVTCDGNAPCLLRGGVPMVEGIEDIQFAYACDGCNAAVNGGIPDGIPDDQNASGTFDTADFITDNSWNALPMMPDRIRLVEINIVARQAQEDQGVVEGGARQAVTPNPAVVSDHDPSGDPGYNVATYQLERRRVLTRIVQTRNIGL